MREAFYIATTGRPGPVLIDLPKDVTSAPVHGAVRRRRRTCPATSCPGTRRPGRCSKTAALLIARPKRPVLYVGHGAVISGAGTAIMQLAEKLQAPVVNTLLGKGAVAEDHPLHLGMLGMHGTAYANKAVIDCDLIMAIGARWDDRITGKLSEFCTDATKIHVDIDPAEFDKIVRARRATARRRAARDRGPAAAGRQARHRATGCKQIDGWRKQYPAQVPEAAAACARSTCSTGSTRSAGATASSPPTSASTRCGRRSSA